jgi:hypothetical protein
VVPNTEKTKCSIAASERFANLTTATKSVFHTNSCPPSFNLPLYFRHIYINSTTVCPLPHTDPQHRPESPRSSYLTPIHNTGPSPLDPATWPLPEHYLAGLRPAALPASTTSQLCPDVALEKVVTRRPGEGRRPPPRRRPADPATRPPPKHVPGH